MTTIKTKNTISAEELEHLYDLAEVTKEQRREKHRLIKGAERARDRRGKIMKPYLWAERNILLSEAYANVESFEADYDLVKLRLDETAAVSYE